MIIETTRFGATSVDPEDILLFPAGLFGLDNCRHWVLLADAENESVAWLQSATRPDTALAVVSPRRFAPDYKVRVAPSQLQALDLGPQDQLQVLTIVNKSEGRLTLNLRAPLLVNLSRRLGRQMVTNDEQPLQLPIAEVVTPLRKSA